MTSRIAQVASFALAGLMGLQTSAQALPLLGVGAAGGGYLSYYVQGQGQTPANTPGLTLEGSAEAFGLLDVSGVLMSNFSTRLAMAEVVLRKEFSMIPMLSLKPGIGYQGGNLLTGGLHNGPIAKLQGTFSPILLPLAVEAEVSGSYPLGMDGPYVGAMAGVVFSPLPLVSLGVRYRIYDFYSFDPTVVNVGFLTSPHIGGLEVGLRAQF